MARELAQTGYFWNLTPDPHAPDPMAQQEDDEVPGPRRRSGGSEPADAFGAETYASVPRYGEPEGDQVDEYADDALARFAQDEAARADAHPDPEAADDADGDWFTEGEFGPGTRWVAGVGYVTDDAAEAQYDVDGRYGDQGAADLDEVFRDPRSDEPRQAEPAAETGDGLSALFGGAGFGVTGPMGVVAGAAAEPAAASAPAPAPVTRPDRFDPGSDDPFAAFGRDDRYDTEDRGRTGGGSGGGRPTGGDDGGGRSPVKALAWIAGALAVIVLGVAGFALVTRVLAPSAPTDQSASGSQDVVELPEPTAMQAPGVYQWTQLFGGECLEPFQDAWAAEFTVVDCATPHSAQLVLRGEVSTDEAAPFPGEAEVAAQVAQLCAAEGVIDPAAVGDVTDLQMQASYPVDEEQWTSGERTFYCFVYRSGGEPLAVSVAGPGPQA